MNLSKRVLVAFIIVVVVGVGATVGLYFLSMGAAPPSRPLPPGCVKSPDGFLVVASTTGYNDSIAHGAPTKSWPIISVHQGQNVTITVCNTDVEAHGFQVTHYYDSNEVTIVPGQVIRVSFIADQAGSFDIYCDIFCAIHLYMQNGLLTVTA
ncbi:MAG: cupredoxin domain-containing protein [Thaumarchaeota archaeon]|nr:cupredoxin domain-containing protein [Nitrososphaerota archaeon]